jgi:hypothetical protein
MISQLDFEPGDYHLRVMIERMEREGRSEHAIVDAVRAASDQSPAAEADVFTNRATGDHRRDSDNWVRRLRPSGLHRTDGAARC